jgi:hypothetical protein
METKRFPMKRFALGLLLVCLIPLSAGAKDAFKDLPGVRDPAEARRNAPELDCTSRIVVPWPNPDFPHRHGLGYRAHSCEYGNVAVGSDQPPNLIEYRKYKEHY